MQIDLHELPDHEAYYYFGSHGFCLFSKSNFDNEQLGYRVNPDGTNLTGTKEGDWLPTWYTIGRDTTVGDPFFVDTSRADYPVYTAMHGQGEWSPVLVSSSLHDFIASLKFIKDKSNQSEELIEPNDSTITDEDELDEIKSHLVSLCGNESDEFWDMIIEQHQDWILESED